MQDALAERLAAGLQTREVPQLPEIWIAYGDALELVDRCEAEGVEILGFDGLQSTGRDVIDSVEMLTDFNELSALERGDRVAAAASAAREILPKWAPFSPVWIAMVLDAGVVDPVDVYTRLGVKPEAPKGRSKVGISRSALAGGWPLHGLRHRPERGTNGWYIWAGEYSEDADFFQPMHVEHVTDRLPAVAPYLALPPGYRFLIAPGREDVWEDVSLLSAGS